MHKSILRARQINRSILMAAAAAALPAMLSPSLASAATYTWDNNGATPNNPQDGAGTWNNTLPNFWDGATNVTWNAAGTDTAVFGAGGTGGSVTIVGAQTIGGLSINSAGYILTGGTISVIGQTPVSVTVPATGTISTLVTGAGSVDFSIASAGTLSQTVASTFTGGATLNGGGTLNIGATDKVGNGSLTIINGTLRFNDGRTITTAVNVNANNTGTIVIAGNGSINAALSGAGTIVLDGAAGSGGNKAFTLPVASPNMTGTVKAVNGAIIRFFNNNTGSPAAIWDLGTTGVIGIRSGSNTANLGDVIGQPGSLLHGAFGLDSVGTLSIGALGNTSTFGGTILNQTSARITHITKVGTGNWTVTGTNTYTGNTTLTGGTLTIGTGGSIANSGTFIMNGGNLDTTANGGITLGTQWITGGAGGVGKVYGNVTAPAGAVIVPGTIGTATTLSFGSDLNLTGGDIRMDLAGPGTIGGGVNDYISVAGNLNLASGSLFINPLSGFGPGTYTLGNYGTATLSSNVALVFGQRATGTLTASGGVLSLNVNSIGSTGTLNWAGNVSNNWNVSGDQNFFNTTTSTQDAFFQNDAVLLTDGAVGTTTINKVGLIQPGLLRITADTNNYTIGGPGTLTGSILLSKNGLSTATLSTGNNFLGIDSGGVIYGASANAGTLVLGAGNAISSVGTVTIAVQGGALMLSNSVTAANNVNIFTDTSTIGVITGNGTFSGIINDQGNPGNKITNVSIPASGSILSFAPTSLAATFTGTLDLGTSNGQLRFQGSTSVSTPGAINLGTGSALMFSRNGNAGTISIGALSGGPNTRFMGTSTSDAAGSGTVPTLYQIGANNQSSTFAGTISNGTHTSVGTTSIAKLGAGTLFLGGNNTYTGTTSVTNGALIVNGNHTGGGTYTVTTTLGGSGTITAPVIATAARLVPGAAPGATGNLTVGSLTLGGSQLDLDIAGGNADSITVLNTLTQGAGNTINLTDNGGTFGRYVLVDYNGTALADLSAFSPGTFSVAGQTGTLTNNTINTSVDLVVKNPSATDRAWSANGGGAFTDGTKWSGGAAPAGDDVAASFGSILTGPGSVDVSGTQTVGFIDFNTTTGAYNLNGTGSIVLNVTGGYAGITVASGNQTIGVPVTIQDQGVIAVNSGGTLTLGSPLNFSSKALIKSGAGELHTSKLTGGSLTVNAGKLIVDAKGSTNSVAGTSVVNSLSITGTGSVDLKNNALIVDYTTLGSTVSDIRGNLASGKLGTSLTAGGFQLGYADAAPAGITTFGGVALPDATAVVVGYTYGGDANLDGTVNALDFNAVAANFGATTNKVWTQGDFSYDGLVNTDDFTALSLNFGKSLAAPPAPSLGTLVPEPASLGALAVLGLFGRRRRR